MSRFGPIPLRPLSASSSGVYAKQALEASGTGEQEQPERASGFLGSCRGEYYARGSSCCMEAGLWVDLGRRLCVCLDVGG